MQPRLCRLSRLRLSSCCNEATGQIAEGRDSGRRAPVQRRNAASVAAQSRYAARSPPPGPASSTGPALAYLSVVGQTILYAASAVLPEAIGASARSKR